VQLARARPVDAAILDLQMPKVDGLEALRQIRKERPDLPVLILTAHGSVATAVEAVRAGAFDFLEKPPSTDRILVALQNALRLRRLESENEALRGEATAGREMVGQSPVMQALRETVRRVAPTESRVLVTGENGTGKELVALALHEGSLRAEGPFVRVNCAAVPEGLFESELFGHEKGAFTGAIRARAGKFERADGGTLFLDEIGEVPLPLQPKLLRVIETGEVERVGEDRVRRADIRLIAATNRDLDEMVREGSFREDLFFRLNVVPLQVPPLRDRAGDARLLVEHFLDRIAGELHQPARRFAEGALRRMEGYAWPGNVRELRNLVERCLILAPAEIIEEADLLALAPGLGGEGGAGAAAPLRDRLEEAERRFVRQACEQSGWNLTRAAETLGLERSHLYKKMKSLGIERPEK
jgi:two-component system nitrogen regulation response regulator NtrX